MIIWPAISIQFTVHVVKQLLNFLITIAKSRQIWRLVTPPVIAWVSTWVLLQLLTCENIIVCNEVFDLWVEIFITTKKEKDKQKKYIGNSELELCLISYKVFFFFFGGGGNRLIWVFVGLRMLYKSMLSACKVVIFVVNNGI